MASTEAASSLPDSQQRKFYPDDICVLKSDRSMVGIVDRTFYDVETHEPLEESLIVSHVPVPEKELMEFLDTGVPGKGYVYVAFSEPTQGNSLVHEDDLELVDRPLEIGHIVKRHPRDTVSGTVISTSTKCTLEPIAFRSIDPNTGEYGALRFSEKPPSRSGSSADQHDVDSSTHEAPPLLHDIPAEELMDSDEFREGDYIIYRQKVGIIQQVDRDVVLMQANKSVVSPLNPYVLELPLSIGNKPIVSLPSGHETLPTRLDAPAGDDIDMTIPSETLYAGQFVKTTHKNLRRGEWISGAWTDMQDPEGHVLATPAMDVHVDWLCSNIFSVGLPFFGPTSEVIRASTLQGQAITYNYGRLPRNSQERNVKCGSYLTIGDRVRFRDPAGAAVKYPQFDRIPKDQTFGHDLNIFKVVSCKTQVTIQWQDLSVTTEPATSLHKFSGLENEVWPGELVTLKEEIETETIANTPRNSPGPLDFPADPLRSRLLLRPKKIGVVQSVNSKERIASVRWYRDPKVELLHNGNVLKPSSVLGDLGDEITDVSMYELTTHPGLVKSRGEMVLLVPEKIHQSNIPQTPSHPSPTGAGPCLLSYLFPANFTQTNMYLDHLKSVLVELDWFKNSVDTDQTPLPPRHSVRRDDFSLSHPIDWIGHIISLDIDGTITVRLAGLQECRDVRVPLEKILMVLDDDATAPSGPSDPMDDDEFEFYEPDDRPIIRTIEYEGGQRLDMDSGDEMWMTEDENDDIDDGINEPEVTEIKVADRPDSNVGEEPKVDETDRTALPNNGLAILNAQQPTSCPPNFAILDTLPPSNHHFLRTHTSEANIQRLRRIRKEYQILESSLPQGIYARTWESRIDLLRVVIIGPQGTPYEHAPFVIDLHFDENFPNLPPATFFHSWTNGMGRINPNMYEDGKICLSILGTWPPKNPDENWNPSRSTVLQILVSIMGLVLVKDPFYNEAGFEAFASEGDSRIESTQYTEKAFVMTRSFIKHALENSIPSFEDVLVWHYLPGPAGNGESERPQLLKKAITEADAMIEHHNSTSDNGTAKGGTVASPFVSRLSLGAVVMLRKHITALKKILSAAANSSESQ
ncbi:hypothetical protein VTN00DRAFT_8346 [Thermoascus crustaceus]|uniref:uncharacterized protein n=1 Tax=Thermoascus crustaceus TaxID=5088 RepID=UPI0037448F2A